MDNARFDRLETKIDDLTKVVTAVVRVEEKILASNDRLDRIEVRVDTNEKDIDSIAELARANNGVAKFADKIFWLVVGGAIGLVFYLLRGA